MLFKNLILPALLAGKSLASPLSIIIEIDQDRQDVRPIHYEVEYPYESIIAGLETQQAAIEDITNSVLTLEDAGSKGFTATVADLRVFSKSLYSSRKSLPTDELTEGETSFVQNAFVKTTDALTVLSEVVYGYNATIKDLDTKGDFYNRFGDIRTGWNNYYSGLKPLLYVCDAEEKKDGCEGVTPFNVINEEIVKVFKIALKSVYQKALTAQFDL